MHKNGKIVILFKRLGPYHVARAQAASRKLDVVWLQMSISDRVYAWERVASDGLEVRNLITDEGVDAIDTSGAKLSRALDLALRDVPVRAMVVPGWSQRGALVAIRWAVRRHLPIVVMSASNGFDEQRQPWREWIKRRLVGIFSSGLVGGNHARDYLLQLGMSEEQVFLGYNAIDNFHFASPQREINWTRPAYAYLASSRFIRKKNLFRLLDAYSNYRKMAGTDYWRLVILGGGELQEPIEAHAERLGVENDVSFPGFRQYEELPSWYGAAGCFVHPSTTEQWGLVVNEAMAAGLPVLVSHRCGCAPNLVQEGVNGFTFDPYDVQGLSNLMFRMAHGGIDLDRMGRASRDIIADWGPERFADGLEKAVEAALAAPLPKPSLLDKALLWALIQR